MSDQVITGELLRTLRNDLSVEIANITAAKLDWACKKEGLIVDSNLISRRRVAHLVAQLAHESGFRLLSESFNYSPQGLMSTFGTHFTQEQANQYGRWPTKAADQVSIANLAYGGRMGNDQPGDGWKFRGRGWPQLTGKENYRRYGSLVGYDLVAQPDLMLQYGVCSLVTAAFWNDNNCSQYADRGGVEQVSAVTQRWNGGQNGLSERQYYYNVAARFLGLL